MTLGALQRKFTLMVGKLILKAYETGYELTLGEGYDDDGVGHMKGSMHYIRLAQDLNLFKDGVWLDKGPAARRASISFMISGMNLGARRESPKT